jgi:hypothetical protein
VNPVVVHRAGPGRELRRVTHRATGRYLGLVGRHDPMDSEGLGGLWSAWGPFDEGSEGAVAEPRSTMWEASLDLLDPEALRPWAPVLVCGPCASRTPRPRPCLSGRCETPEAAEARDRAEYPEDWAHFDWLRSL